MRNPNGYGCVYKASGNRRKPYIVRITIGWTNEGKQIFKSLGSYSTVSEANKVLANYNADPYDIDASRITFEELYQKWSTEKYPKVSKSMMLSYKNAYRSCSALYNFQFANIRKHHLQMLIDNTDKTYSGKERIKMLICQMSKFAMENDIIKKDYSPYLDLGERPNKTLIRHPFTEKEIKELYQSVHIYRYTDTILMMIFSGVRPSELLLTETKNVNLNENYFICGIKNSNSKNRKVPISKFVRPFFEKYYDDAVKSNSRWLIQNTEGQQMQYSNFNRDKFHKIMEQLQMNHMPHDGRHSFATFMDKVNANKLSTQLIMGHSPKILVDSVYIHKNIEDLQTEIDKMEILFDLNEMLSYIDDNYWKSQYTFSTFSNHTDNVDL